MIIVCNIFIKKKSDHTILGPSVLNFKISLIDDICEKWINQRQIIHKTSFGGSDSRFEPDFIKDTQNDGTWIRLAVGFNDTFENIESSLNK